jgi:hypothetical protein
MKQAAWGWVGAHPCGIMGWEYHHLHRCSSKDVHRWQVEEIPTTVLATKAPLLQVGQLQSPQSGGTVTEPPVSSQRQTERLWCQNLEKAIQSSSGSWVRDDWNGRVAQSLSPPWCGWIGSHLLSHGLLIVLFSVWEGAGIWGCIFSGFCKIADVVLNKGCNSPTITPLWLHFSRH